MAEPSSDSAVPASANNPSIAPLRLPRSFSEFFGARGGPLLILRAFLGITFLFAGLQKLANPNFFNGADPGSFLQQVKGSIVTSPLHGLLHPALHAPTAIALIISFGEIAVGLGTLVGFCSRIAAIGGMLLALTFFLVVSYNDSPYYYGPDIVFLFAWTPLVIARPGTWSLDEVFRRRLARNRATAVADSSINADDRRIELERRVVLQRGLTAGAVAVVGLAGGGAVAAIGRALRSPNTATRSSTAATTPPVEKLTIKKATTSKVSATSALDIGSTTSVPIGGAASFTDPLTGGPGLVLQPEKGTFTAFSAICPHAGCTVAFSQHQDEFICPCHGSEFNGKTGAVIQGPATRGLTPIAVEVVDGDNISVVKGD